MSDKIKIDLTNVGWKCPQCGSIISPYVHVCPNCDPYIYYYTDHMVGPKDKETTDDKNK